VTVAKTYKDTVNLPQTKFDMRANAVKREPELQKFWAEHQIYEQLSQNNPGEIFILHDGPPYANGSLHMGHALNKILKDIINKVSAAARAQGSLCPRVGLSWLAD
jgi:isoleucyl-tRNA synthetase